MRRNRILKIKIALAIIIFMIIGGYSLYEARNLIIGPVLSVKNPKNMAVLKSSLLDIQGETRNIVRIALNDRPIFVDKQGNFSEKILLSPGYNVVKLNVADKFGRVKEKILEVVFKDIEESVAIK